MRTSPSDRTPRSARYTHLEGHTSIGPGATIGPDCQLRDTTVADRAAVVYAVCVQAEIGPGATVGPYAYLRPGTRIGAGAHIGCHVELKNSVVGAGAKVPHLSYVGDADIGERANIGAATIFSNYDGAAKHRTTVGADVFTGSDTILVAPVTSRGRRVHRGRVGDHRRRAPGRARRRPRQAAQLGRLGGAAAPRDAGRRTGPPGRRVGVRGVSRPADPLGTRGRAGTGERHDAGRARRS